MARTTAELEVEGRTIPVSNLGKVLYPASGFTKADVIDYYIRIAPALLPHIRDRALTLKRYPNGVRGPFFYEKNCPAHRPPWVKTAPIWSEGNRRTMHYCLANDLSTLVWAANLADLELHVSLARARAPDRPTVMVFDLDPGPPAGIVLCCEVALRIRELLRRGGLEAFPKTSGSKGLQVYVPLNGPATFERTKAHSRSIAERLAGEEPGKIVAKMQKSLRGGKVFVDWSQNDRHKTTVCAYSLRAKERPAVSTPVSWEEVERCLAKKEAALLDFDPAQALARVEKTGDLFEPVLSLRQRLPSAKKGLLGEIAVEAVAEA